MNSSPPPPPLSYHVDTPPSRSGGGTAPCFFKGLVVIRRQAEFMELIFHGEVIHGGFGATEQLNGCSESLDSLVPSCDWPPGTTAA